ncbi:MAG: hypothetical protein RXO30_09625 [Thermoproteus sp.]
MYVAVAFYSPVHGEEYVERRFRDAALHLPEVLGPFKSADEAPEVRAKALLAVTLTGGTGVAVAEYARRLGVRSVVTLGFPEHNSAASSLSARSYLEAEGLGFGLCTARLGRTAARWWPGLGGSPGPSRS